MRSKSLGMATMRRDVVRAVLQPDVFDLQFPMLDDQRRMFRID